MAGARQPAVYLFTEERRGEFDGYRADRALAEIRRTLGATGSVAEHAYQGSSAEAAAEAIETPSLFGSRTLIVLRGVEAIDDRAADRLLEAMERQAPQVTLVVIARGGDMRRRFLARCREMATRVPVDHPRPNEMPGIADQFARERGRRLDDQARALVVDCVGTDLLVLAHELDKLAAAVPAGRAILVEDVRRVTVAARAHGNFEAADAICARDGARATALLAETLDEGTAPIALIGAFAASLKSLLAATDLVARGRTPDAALRQIQANPYQRRTLERGLHAYRPRELQRGLMRLAEIDVASKSGAVDPRALLEEWVLGLCRPSNRPARTS